MIDQQLYIGLILGLIIGFVLAVKTGAGGVTHHTENDIGKLKTKGDNSPIDTAQLNQLIHPKKRSIFAKIFKKKNQ